MESEYTIVDVITLLLLIGIGIFSYIWKNGIKSYLEEKGKGLAKQEDLEGLTKIVEDVKADVSDKTRIRETKYKIIHEACMEALNIIDSELSIGGFKDAEGNEIPITEQPKKNVEFVRTCHNKLILSCESSDIVELFLEIMSGSKPGEIEKNKLELLDKFRNLIRKELDFGEELCLDKDRIWIGMLGSEVDKSSEK